MTLTILLAAAIAAFSLILAALVTHLVTRARANSTHGGPLSNEVFLRFLDNNHIDPPNGR